MKMFVLNLASLRLIGLRTLRPLASLRAGFVLRCVDDYLIGLGWNLNRAFALGAGAGLAGVLIGYRKLRETTGTSNGDGHRAAVPDKVHLFCSCRRRAAIKESYATAIP